MRFDNKQQVTSKLIILAEGGRLTTPKHDPHGLHTTYPSYRSVVSWEVMNDTTKFLSSGDFSLHVYEDKQYGADICIVFPSAESAFNVPASGVVALSPLPTEELDCLVVVDGKKQGPHWYGDRAANILKMESTGRLVHKRELG
jgi:hypothetical protein